MDVVTRRIDNDAVTPHKVAAGLREHSYAFEEFRGQPTLYAAAGYGNPAGTTGEQNSVVFPQSGLYAQYIVLGAGQTILGPVFSYTTGLLDITQDATAAEGVEYVFGGSHPRNNYGSTIGTTLPRFWRLKFSVEDVAGSTGRCVFGLRKQEAAQADFNDYDELAALNVRNGVVYTETILNNAATVETDTGQVWAATETHEFKLVEYRRAILFYFDGVSLGTVPSFSFDSGEVVVPFWHFLHSTDVAGVVAPVLFETGFVTDRKDRP